MLCEDRVSKDRFTVKPFSTRNVFSNGERPIIEAEFGKCVNRLIYSSYVRGVSAENLQETEAVLAYVQKMSSGILFFDPDASDCLECLFEHEPMFLFAGENFGDISIVERAKRNVYYEMLKETASDMSIPVYTVFKSGPTASVYKGTKQTQSEFFTRIANQQSLNLIWVKTLLM